MRAMISFGFLRGYGRALNLGGMKQWPDIYGSKAKDYKALRSDWQYVGTCIRESADKYGKEINKAQSKY